MPFRFTPINSKQNPQKAFQQINNNFMMLDAEAYSKTIKSGSGTAMVSGKQSNGRFGELIYDNTNRSRAYFGQAPNNGRPGLWITKDGYDVLSEIK